MKRQIATMFLAAAAFLAQAQTNVETQRQYISGTGCDDMVEWDFMCTGGRNSGKWTKIGVPSCWELQGFGTYQYGMRFYGKATPEGIADEKGLYKTEFTLPAEWEGREIYLVFEGSMTDTYATINGRKAGVGLHQGGFNRFMHNVSDRVFFGKKKNRLEVEVSKESADPQVNMAERRADFWNFGGIFRPVFIVSKPAQNIHRVAIDAGMDGRFKADCYLNRAVQGAKVKVDILDSKGKKAGSSEFAVASDIAKVDFSVNSPALWTAETPNLYTAVFTLLDQSGKTLHVERQKFGFRTIEIRQNDGVYINGSKVIFKGVNRHSFRPETGRTLSKQKNIEDVLLIKSMNMNSVRLGHYAADPEFLEACDSLGLYVENELLGWHKAVPTIVGQKLVESLVTRDVNHPSVIFWSNGNEGGFNYELEPFFYKFDPQKRVVLYPWANRNGIETKHYRSYGETQEYMRQPEIFMPTEFLHGLYDGGHGAGLADYWEMMMANPRCAGGFLWDLADQGVVRTDMNNIVDCMGNFGADGIVGPHFEKEGSFYTIKEIWSPVIVDLYSGVQECRSVGVQTKPQNLTHSTRQLNIKNRYDFLNLNTCKLRYRYLDTPALGNSDVKTLGEGTVQMPDVKPWQDGTMTIPANDNAKVLEVTVIDKNGTEVMTWSWPIKCISKAAYGENIADVKAAMTESDSKIEVKVGNHTYTFSKENGYLQGVSVGGKHISLENGPRLLAVRRSDRSFDQFYNHDDKEAEKKKTQYSLYADQGKFDKFTTDGATLTANYKHGSLQQVKWTFAQDGSVKMDYKYNFGGIVDEMGLMFDYPESKVKSKSWVGNGPYRVWQNRLHGPQFGYWHNNYNDPIPGETFEYPEFKGFFANVEWMQIETEEGKIGIAGVGCKNYIGVYQPRDGRDHLLYELPESGISILKVIPAVRNKVNTTDLNGPSALPYRAFGDHTGSVKLTFE